jgi:NAD(P)-dependent dehydrogenase (short-subunit alcohol dehydrogenase family)
MSAFGGKLAVVTGGGSGMGRELVKQLAAQGCSVATCDVFVETAEATVAAALEAAPDGTVVTAHACDVSDAAAMDRFGDEVRDRHATDHVDYVFNNAGIGGGGSMITDPREAWERTFNVCWGGVYNGTRTFLPMLIASERGHLVNTSSVNGFYASIGPGVPHTAYSAAKFAVRGFSEALIEDLRVNAPHVSVSVVMPGHIGTDIVHNSRKLLGPVDVAQARANLTRRGIPAENMDDAAVLSTLDAVGDMFRDTAPLTAVDAADVILDGVRDGRWRILVGADAHQLDEAVRADPEGVYAPGASLFELMRTE